MTEPCCDESQNFKNSSSLENSILSQSLSPKKEKKNRHAETKERDFCHEIDFWTPGAREGRGFYTF